MSMPDSDRRRRRQRTGFENDLRECFVKIFLGVVLGLAAKILVPLLWFPAWDAVPWWLWVGSSIVLMFWLHRQIHGHSRFSDDAN